MLQAIVEILLSLLAVFGLLCLSWLLFGRLLSPASWSAPAYAVVPARGDGAGLEQTVKGLLWLRAGHLARFTLVIADAGLDSEGRRLARLLADREPGVLLCPLAALPDRLTEG